MGISLSTPALEHPQYLTVTCVGMAVCPAGELPKRCAAVRTSRPPTLPRKIVQRGAEGRVREAHAHPYWRIEHPPNRLSADTRDLTTPRQYTKFYLFIFFITVVPLPTDSPTPFWSQELAHLTGSFADGAI